MSQRKRNTKSDKRILAMIMAWVLVILPVIPGRFVMAADTTETASATEPASGFHQEQSVREDGRTLTVTAVADPGILPFGAQMEVTALSEDKNVEVQEKLEKECADNERELVGFLAYDIAFTADGEEIEPSGDVNITMEWLEAAVPDGVDDDADVSVQHFTEDAVEEVDTASVKTADENSVESVEMTVDSFSVYTITWTRDSSSAQRVGTVRIHTVDEDVNEIEDTDTYTATELSKVAGESGILSLSDWVKTKILDSGYTYSEARLGGVSGQVITGFKVETGQSGSSDTYTLRYTSDSTVNSSSTWVNMADAVSDEEKNNAEVYLLYHKAYVRPVTIHFLTLDGTAITDDGGTAIVDMIDAADHTSEYDLAGTYVPEHTPDGYSFSTTRMNTSDENTNKIIVSDTRGGVTVGSVTGTYYRFMRYQNGNLQMARGDKNWTNVSGSDIYITFKADDSPKSATTFTVHYVNDQKQTLDGQEDTTFTLDGSSGSTERELDSGNLVRNIDGKVFIGSYLGTASGSLTENTTYVTTDYLNVSKVKVDTDGKISVQIAVSDGPMTLDMTRNGRWSCTTQKGRTFTLRREVTGFGDNQSVRYSLVDDQISTSAVDLNLKSTDGTTEVYTGSSGSEKTSAVYTVTAVTKTEGDTTATTYMLSVSEWQENDQTDIYQVYGDPSSITNPAITVRNDLVYTGHLVVQMDSALQNALDNAGVAGTAGENISGVSYTWYKIVNNGTAAQVQRQQSGYTWNIAQNEDERTWLDLSADGGALNASQSSVKYYVVLNYTYNGQPYTATSDQLSMINYDELWNGGFETPTMTTNQVSNSWYYSRGVWRTTGLGTGGMRNHDIEIINTTWASYWKNSYSWNPALDFKAHGGNQFAELNCEAAGALYQDVVTHPYETLNYWLSHRARGRVNNSTSEYDTMYLVIMPTKLAMTSGSDGGELKEQSDLEAYIQSHGGFTSQLATGEEAVVTYRDEASGVLIERISSSDQAWHDISVANGYTAMAGLTRFFFVAGPTASGSNTVGNFLDDVGFSQQLPQPSSDQFQMVVTKTFSNLDLSDIAQLADNFTLTIHAYSDSGAENEDSSAALDGAKLTFSASSDNNLTLKAAQGDTDLFSGSSGSGGVVTVNDDAGTVTMTWTILDNSISNIKYYTVEETGQNLDGYTAVTAQSGSVQSTVNNNGTETNTTKNIDSASYVAEVSGGSVLRMNFTNSYNRNSQITVQKIFSGITPTTVQELSSGYTVTVTREDTGAALHLVNNEQKPYSDKTLPDGVQAVNFSVRQGSGGVSILAWTITGWDAGNYTVQETGYHPKGEASQYNTLASVTVNGVTVAEDASGAEVSVEEGVTIGGTSSDVPSIKEQNSEEVSSVGDKVVRTDTETNLLIAEYENGGSRGYLVWTPETLGANVRQAILNYIKTKFEDSSVTLGQISFYSSDNPGAMPVNDASVNYDASTRTVTFNSSVNTIWQRYYGTTYTLERTVVGSTPPATEIVANDEPEIRIRNNYNPILKIQKVEKGHNDRVLSGVGFKLYQLNGTEKEYYLDTSTVSKAVFGTGTAKEFTTDSNGTVNIGVLPQGIYYLEETNAPDGYLRVPDIPLFVSEDGVVTLLDSSGNSVSRTDYAEVTLTDPYYTITVSDQQGKALPAAGGAGGWAMSLAYLWGLTAVAVIGGLIAFRRSRRP